MFPPASRRSRPGTPLVDCPHDWPSDGNLNGPPGPIAPTAKGGTPASDHPPPALWIRGDRLWSTPRGVLRLLSDLGLRRAEVVGLDLADLDLERGTVHVTPKGGREKERRTLPAATHEALHGWLAFRGDSSGPLFTNFDRAGKGLRLTGTSAWRIVRALGAKVDASVPACAGRSSRRIWPEPACAKASVLFTPLRPSRPRGWSGSTSSP